MSANPTSPASTDKRAAAAPAVPSHVPAKALGVSDRGELWKLLRAHEALERETRAFLARLSGIQSHPVIDIGKGAAGELLAASSVMRRHIEATLRAAIATAQQREGGLS